MAKHKYTAYDFHLRNVSNTLNDNHFISDRLQQSLSIVRENAEKAFGSDSFTNTVGIFSDAGESISEKYSGLDKSSYSALQNALINTNVQSANDQLFQYFYHSFFWDNNIEDNKLKSPFDTINFEPVEYYLDLSNKVKCLAIYYLPLKKIKDLLDLERDINYLNFFKPMKSPIDESNFQEHQYKERKSVEKQNYHYSFIKNIVSHFKLASLLNSDLFIVENENQEL